MIAAMSLVLVFCAAELSRAAAGANAPVGEVKATIDEATPVFENRNLSPAEREVELSAIAEKHFDLTYMARSALGTIKLRQWVEKLGVPGFLIALGILSFAPLAWSQSPVAATDHPASANPQMQEVEGIPGLTRGPMEFPLAQKSRWATGSSTKALCPTG